MSVNLLFTDRNCYLPYSVRDKAAVLLFRYHLFLLTAFPKPSKLHICFGTVTAYP